MADTNKFLSDELHGLLCQFAFDYVDQKPDSFEQFGKGFFQKASTACKKPEPFNSQEACQTLATDPAALYKLVECDPEILQLRDKLKYLVLGYLMDKPKNLPAYGLEYFQQRIGSLGKNSSKELRRPGVASESYDPEADQISLGNCTTIHEKTPREMEILQEKVKNVLVFRSLDETQMCRVLAAMFKVEIPKGSLVIRQGDDGDFFYVVDDGIFEAYVKDNQGQEQRVTTYKGTGSFGELALLYNMPRIATVKAITAGTLWCLDRESFRKIVLKSAFNKRQIYENLLSNIPVLQCLTDYERQALADALQPMTYEDGECIIKQADDAAGMFIVEEGTVLFSYVDETGQKMQLSEIEKGGYFGELALVTDKQRAVSAYAIGHVQLAYIDKESFERILGPCMDVMKRNAQKYEDQLDQLKYCSK